MQKIVEKLLDFSGVFLLSFRWVTDPPEMIISQAIEKHQKMIKEFKGVPGPKRLEEAKKIQHCALSLVGKPIMYPHISEYLKMLHSKKFHLF